ncbi:UNVERIFIED_CONTAM: hypothetical protein Slati_2544100, partial [Sesamum latifolium]
IMENTQIQGQLPVTLFSLSQLQTVFLSNNMLTGPLPNLTGMNSLNYVIMENTQIQGQLPVTLFSLSQLQTVALKNNRINGTLTIGSSHIAAIQSLKDIWDHVPPNWSGDDPCGDGWSGISCINNRVVSITLASINLSGQLSSDIAKLAELQTLMVNLPRWSLKILAKEELAAISDLEAGSSATEWYSGSDLKKLYVSRILCVTAAAHCAIREILEMGTRFLSNNMLTGPLPNLTGMNSLNYVPDILTLNPQDNGEHTNSGQLPVTLFSLSQLQTVALKNNRINGTLTIGSSHSNQLQLIDLQNNSIEGFTLQADYSVQIIVSVAFLSSLIHRTRRQLKTARLFPALQIEFPAQAEMCISLHGDTLFPGSFLFQPIQMTVSFLILAPRLFLPIAAIQSLKDIWDHVPPNWSGADPCGDGWSGISCINNRVVSITLASINLSGQLSSDIAKLAELQTCRFSILLSKLLFLHGASCPVFAKPMVNLPRARNGRNFLKVILAKEELVAISNLEAGFSTTEWYSGSDLKGNAWLEILRRVRHLQLSLKLCGFIPRGLLFAKFGSNLTAFLDLVFLREGSPVDWKQKLDQDTGTMKSQSNIGSICSVRDLLRLTHHLSILRELKEQALTNESIGKIIGWGFAITLCIPPKLHPRSRNSSFEVKVQLWGNIPQSSQIQNKSVKNSLKEKKLLAQAVPAGDIGVTFADTEAIEDVKETSKERTCDKGATKLCKGIRRATPRTSKTLLAKAVATEAGAKFINICVGSIASKVASEESESVPLVLFLKDRKMLVWKS